MDVLSDVLQAVRLTGAVYFDVDAGSPWVGETPSTQRIAAAVMPGVEHIISFHAIVSGSCWAAIDDGSVPPVRVSEGDVLLYPSGAPNVLSSSPGQRGEVNMGMYYRPVDQNLPFAIIHGGTGDERTRFICGYLGLDAKPFNPLLSALPQMICLRKPADGRTWVTDLFRVAMAEGGRRQEGGETILSKLSELMFVELIRRYLETLPEDARGWLSGLRDPHVGEALQLIHARPAEDWTLDRLARAVGLSRTSFSGRFTEFVGVSPMQYIARWRLQLARRLLERPQVSIAQAAAEVGYESETAFNRAFKRYVGIPPGIWRKGRSKAAEATLAS